MNLLCFSFFFYQFFKTKSTSILLQENILKKWFFLFFFKILLLHYDWPIKCESPSAMLKWNHLQLKQEKRQRSAQWKKIAEAPQLIGETVGDYFCPPTNWCLRSAGACPVLCSQGGRVRTCPRRVVRESAEAVWVPTARSDSPSSRAHLSLSTVWIKSQRGFVQFSTLIGHWGALWES